MAKMHLIQLSCSHHSLATRLTKTHKWNSLPGGSTGTYVLTFPGSSRVMKMGDDLGLKAFVSLIRQSPPNPAFPIIYADIDGIFPNNPWRGVWCEKLRPLDSTESANWSKWIQNDWMANKGQPSSDPFGVVTTLNALQSHATNSGLNLDVIKTDNVMMRQTTSQIVFSDPLV